MTDKRKAFDAVMKFLNDKDKRILLVRGYDDDAKLGVVLSCLNEKFEKGIIRCSSMKSISNQINGAFSKKLLPYNVKSTIDYKLGSMTVNVNSYATHTASNPRGNENTFILYHPVQTVLDDSKRYSKFLSEIKNSESSKIILVTTIEWSIKDWDIEDHVDEVFFYNVEKDNPQVMSNLRRNGAI